MRMLDIFKISISTVIMLVTAVIFITNYDFQTAFACQVVDPRPELYERADFIFIGTVTKAHQYAPLENGEHVTLHVTKSWKGVDTEYVTVHNDYGFCGGFPFIEDQSFLVYGFKNIYEINIPFGSGSMSAESSSFLDRDTQYLDSHYASIELKTGHTMSVSIFPVLQILGGFTAIAMTTFVVIRRA